MVEIGDTQLLMGDGTIRTFKSKAARTRFENWVKKHYKKNLKPLRIRFKKPRIKKLKKFVS